MSASSRARVLSVVAAGVTATSLLAATTTPASATPRPPIPTPSIAKLKLPDGTAASRVIAGRYLVETVATPLSRGGSRITNDRTAKATTAAAKASGAKITSSYSDLWSGVSVTATEAQIKVIAQSPSVKAVYPVLRVDRPMTARSATHVSSALAQIGAAAAPAGQDGTGIKVGVIDTGIDYNNPDLGGGSTFPTTHVAYGYDFVGDAYNGNNKPVPDANPDDCDGHGTHVAGIIGANGTGDGDSTRGVAPGVTLGAYRILGCQGSTDTDIILKALTKAKADKMNIVNLSIGSNFDSWPSYPDAVAAANLAKAGVVVVVSAGNSGDTGLFSAGSPAVGAGVISVASYEAAVVRSKAIAIAGDKIPYTQVAGAAEPPADNAAKMTLKLASNGTACTTPTTVAPGTALLVQYGSCSQQGDVHQQLANASAAHASAVVFYYAADADLATFSDSSHSAVPAIGISGAQGAALAAKLNISGQLPFTWLSVQDDATNPTGGKLSTFSSAGLAADLSLVPTITAPGGKIYSTLPVEQGGHGNLSGTSMAAPFIAGTAAVMLQVKPTTLKGHPADLSKLLYNTAAPIMKNTELKTSKPEGVFRQGSGLVNLTRALAAKVTASPSTIKLGEGTSHTVTISLTNKTTAKLTYKIARISGVSAAASTSGGNEVGTTTPIYAWSDAGFKASKTVTVKAGKTVKVKVKITAPNPSALKGKAGMLYGGWVQFTTTGAGNTVTVPFAGMRGDYQSVKVLNKFKFFDGDSAWTLPTLGYVSGIYLTPETGKGHTFTMVDDDIPFVFYHLDYPASDVMMKITNTKSKKSYDVILDWSTYKGGPSYKISGKSTHLYKQSRDADFQYASFGGIYKGGEAWSVADGTYTLTLKVLKPLGSSKKKSHWESFTTKPFVIEDQN